MLGGQGQTGVMQTVVQIVAERALRFFNRYAVVINRLNVGCAPLIAVLSAAIDIWRTLKAVQYSSLAQAKVSPLEPVGLVA